VAQQTTGDIPAVKVTVGMTIYPGDLYEMSNVRERGEQVTYVTAYRENGQDLVGISGNDRRWAWTLRPADPVRVAVT